MKKFLVPIVIVIVAIIFTIIFVISNAKSDAPITDSSNVITHTGEYVDEELSTEEVSTEQSAPYEKEDTYFVTDEPDYTTNNNIVFSDYGEQEAAVIGTYFNDLIGEDVVITVLMSYDPSNGDFPPEPYEDILVEYWDDTPYYYLVNNEDFTFHCLALIVDGEVFYSLIN